VKVRSLVVARFSYVLAVVLYAASVLPQAPNSGESADGARLLFRQGEFQAAAIAFQKLIDRHPAAELYAGLVQSLLKQDNVDAAELSSSLAMTALPKSALIHATRGDVLFRRGLIGDAESEYRAALELDEKCARAWLGMGRIFAAISRRARAREAFSKARELDPEDGDAFYYWAVGLEYPKNVAGLEAHLAGYRSDPERDRHEREYLALQKAVAGRKVWIPSHEIVASEIKLEQMLLGPGRVLGVGLKVGFNNHVSARLLLDTGASGITIGHKLAEKMKATRLSDFSLEGAGDSGPVAGYEAWVDKISIGDFEFHDCVIHVSGRNEVGLQEGIIGTDIFEKYLITLDLIRQKLRLAPLPDTTNTTTEEEKPAPEMASFSQVFSFGHLLLMPTRVGSTASGLFVLDTGFLTNAISPALARQVSKVHDSNVQVNGMSGAVKNVYSADTAVLQFSRFRQPNQDIVTFDVRPINRDLGTEVSGFIGFASLKNMKLIIDYRDGLVDFDDKK
jgi:tetratricopeptide (TPR) repeat protein